MGSVNKVTLLGNLGQDPEVRMTATGQQVATVSIATSESWTGKDGKKEEKTEWHRVVLWGKLAELAGKYLKKGRRVYIEGRLQTRSWEDQGQKKYMTEIVGKELVFVDSSGRDAPSAGGADDYQGGYNPGPSSYAQPQQSGYNPPPSYGPSGYDAPPPSRGGSEDDVPF